MARINFFFCRSNQRVDQIIGLYPETLAARNLDVGTRLVLVRQLIAQIGGATWRERNHLIRKMRVVISLLVVAKSAQRFNDGVLRFRLPGIDYVVNLSHIAKMRMIQGTHLGREIQQSCPLG